MVVLRKFFHDASRNADWDGPVREPSQWCRELDQDPRRMLAVGLAPADEEPAKLCSGDEAVHHHIQLLGADHIQL